MASFKAVIFAFVGLLAGSLQITHAGKTIIHFSSFLCIIYLSKIFEETGAPIYDYNYHAQLHIFVWNKKIFLPEYVIHGKCPNTYVHTKLLISHIKTSSQFRNM